MIVLDTTVLVYATGVEHELRDPCRELVRAVADGRVEAATTVEVIQEFVHVRARRRTRADAVELGAAFVDLLGPLVTVTAGHLVDGLRLLLDHDRLGAFDAVLAAAALDVGARALMSADQAFASVPGLWHLVPDATSVRQLLGG